MSKHAKCGFLVLTRREREDIVFIVPPSAQQTIITVRQVELRTGQSQAQLEAACDLLSEATGCSRHDALEQIHQRLSARASDLSRKGRIGIVAPREVAVVRRESLDKTDLAKFGHLLPPTHLIGGQAA